MNEQYGDAVLRTRSDGAIELRVNGVFVMDDRETTSERLLAERVLQTAANPARVAVGGLGLGHTLRALLADDRVEHVLVAELQPAIPHWMRTGVVPGADLLADPRVTLEVGDVREVLAAQPVRSLDAILLDVDNGPDFLVYEDNAEVYRDAFVRTCAARLRPDGELCIWSQADSDAVRRVLAASFRNVAADRVPVRLQERDEAYWLLRGTLPRI